MGNTAPSLTLTAPTNGQLFSFGDTVPFTVTGTDPEDGAVDCAKVKVTYFLGHDSHEHQITSKNGCTGSLTVPTDGEHDSAANLYGVFDAEYTDAGGLTSHSVSKLQPKHRQAEHYSAMSGIEAASHGTAEGGRTVGFTDNGDWISFTPYDLHNATQFSAHVSSAGPGGTLELHAGSATGTLLGTATVAPTGDWETFTDVTADISNAPAGPDRPLPRLQGCVGPGQPVRPGHLHLHHHGSGGKVTKRQFNRRVRHMSCALALTLGAAFLAPAAAGAQPREADPYQVLVFSKTAGFRHDSIPAGIAEVQALGAENGFTVTATEDATAITPENLAKFKAVVFVSTTGDFLDDAQEAALEGYVDGGGGFMGIHAAADAEYESPLYEQLVGAWFKSHPAIQQATVVNEDVTNPATSHFGPTWTHTDELYNYRSNPRATVHVLQSLDESSYTGGEMNGDHPITWCHPQGTGRSFYTGLGHTAESYADPDFQKLLLGGIEYAAGVVQADCSVPGGDGGGPTAVEGESYTSSSGVEAADHGVASGGRTLGFIDNGDWAGYASVDTTGATSFSATVSSAGAGGTIEVRSGSATGPLLGSVDVAPTGGWETFTTVSTPLTAGSGPLFLSFTGGSGSLFDIDSFTLSGGAATAH